MSDHTVTWTHEDCDHENDDCTPRGEIHCHAVGSGESLCRLQEVNPKGKYDYCESWSICDYSDRCHAMCPDFEHHDPGGMHCTEGHPIREVTYCNVKEWVEDVSESHDESWPPEFKDASIDVDWTGEGYLWSYAEVGDS